jgi:hypothetical protein
MKISLIGDAGLVNELRASLSLAGLVVDKKGNYLLELYSCENGKVIIDSIDNNLELHLIRMIRQTSNLPILVTKGKPNDRLIRIGIPDDMATLVIKGIVRAFLSLTSNIAEPKWWKKTLWAFLLPLTLLLFPVNIQAQSVLVNGFWDGLVIVRPIDSVNNAVRVNCILGCTSGGGGGTVIQGAGFGAATGYWNARLSDGTNFYNALTDTQLRASAVPVSGTFFQATQPISGTVTANAGTGTFTVSGSVSVSNFPASQAVTGTFWQTTQPVSGTFWQATQPISGTVTANDVPPTLTKGTQGSTGFSTQDLKDAGRTAISFYANAVASGATGVETLITLTQSKGTGATSSVSTYTITSGKTLRITGIAVFSRGNATATIQTTLFNLRLNTAGACVVTSTPILMGIGTATPATASAIDRAPNPFSSDGYEIAGNGTVSICISANAVFVTNAPTWYVNIIGYEY